ncbi:MAG: hypothetical protein Q9162_001391 [Coniocarpon cinnabarinum]
MDARRRAVTFHKDPESTPMLSIDTSLANAAANTTKPVDVLTPLPDSPRRWWDSHLAFLPTSTLIRRHTIAPRERPRSFRRRSSLRSIFSWTSSKSGGTVKPEREYHQSRFTEHLLPDELGFNYEDHYLSAPLPPGSIVEEESESSSTSSRKTMGSKLKEWPLSGRAEKALQNSPVDSHHSRGESTASERAYAACATIRAMTPEGLPFDVTVSSSAPRDHPCLRARGVRSRTDLSEARMSNDGEEQELLMKGARKDGRRGRVVTWMGKKLGRSSTKGESSESVDTLDS